MKNGITELVFVLDRSGSMASLADDAIGGFNALIEKQKRQSGRCFVTTVLFDTRFERLHDRLPLEQVEPLTRDTYVPGGCTALLDAVGDTIRHIAAIHRYARPEDVPENTLFVITTDGMENASRRYSREEVRRRIAHEQEKYGWQFVFLGANIDAFAAARDIGIREEMIAIFNADGLGMELGFGAVDRAVTCARRAAPISADWKKDGEADHRERKPHRK